MRNEAEAEKEDGREKGRYKQRKEERSGDEEMKHKEDNGDGMIWNEE